MKKSYITIFYIIFFSFFATSLSLFSCKEKDKMVAVKSKTLAIGDETTTVTRDSFAFPSDWVGDWVGELAIHTPKKKNQQLIPMELYIGKKDKEGKHSWTIVFGEGETKQERHYTLLTKDAANGLYQIDENNSIVLDNYLINNTLVTRFAVAGNLLTAMYERTHEGIEFSVISGKEQIKNETGGKEGVPKVMDYPVSVYQRGLLRQQ